LAAIELGTTRDPGCVVVVGKVGVEVGAPFGGAAGAKDWAAPAAVTSS
jgi:hypothetical protein